MQTYRAAVVQLNSQPDVNANLEQAYQFIKQASREGSLLVGLPENFAFLGDFDLRMKQSEQICEQAEEFLMQTAKEFGIYLLGGGYPVPTDKGKVYNRALLVDPEGRPVAQYNKIHLFDVDLAGGESYRESDYVESGTDDPVLYSSDTLGNVGLSICYDIRFPEVYRMLSAAGADILTIPSAFTETTGRVHWKPLLKARAIENTAYIFAPAQTGIHGKKRKTYGHSMIVDPWGDVLIEAGDESGVHIAEIRPERVREIRRYIPSLQHRKIHLKVE